MREVDSHMGAMQIIMGIDSLILVKFAAQTYSTAAAKETWNNFSRALFM